MDPMQFPPEECLADPCNWPFPPTICQVEPCDLGNPVLDDADVQQYMAQTWIESYGPENSPLPSGQRNEKMYFIRESNGSYHLDPVPLQNVANPISSCHYLGNFSSFSGALGILHTHPYEEDETITDQRCIDYVENLGQWDVSEYGYPWYESNISNPDSIIVNTLQIPMYVIDSDQILHLKVGEQMNDLDTFNRCGY